MEKFFKNKNNSYIKYAFFGDSQFRDDLNPDFIDKSYNFASSAESFIETYYKLNYLVSKRNVSIDFIVIQLDLHSFSHTKSDDAHLFADIWSFKEQISYQELADLKKQSYLKIFLKSNLPFIGSGKDFFVEKDITSVHFGWTNQTSDFSKQNKDDIAIIKYDQFFGKNPKIDNISAEYLLMILKLAKENNISVVFIKTPISKEYHEVLKSHNISGYPYYEKFYAEIFDKINNTNEEYHVLDYYNLYFERDYEFRDSNHLKGIGAEDFSKIVYSDLKKIKKN